MKKLAVFFPGIGYTVDKPLMHYSRRLAADAGFEVLLLPYAGFPHEVRGDRKKMEESYGIALSQSRKMLSSTDFSEYGTILFIGRRKPLAPERELRHDSGKVQTVSARLLQGGLERFQYMI